MQSGLKSEVGGPKADDQSFQLFHRQTYDMGGLENRLKCMKVLFPNTTHHEYFPSNNIIPLYAAW